jgi:hypothetical protein
MKKKSKSEMLNIQNNSLEAIQARIARKVLSYEQEARQVPLLDQEAIQARKVPLLDQEVWA